MRACSRKRRVRIRRMPAGGRRNGHGTAGGCHRDPVLRLGRRIIPAYRLPLLVLDATGMRVGELEGLTWGDVDEQRGRWRVSATVSKTRRARWIAVAPALFEAVAALVPRDDRHPDRRVFENFTTDRLRTAISRACVAAGVPVFSP